MNYFDAIPDDLFDLVFVYLELSDILSASACCVRWRILCNTDKIWRTFCKKRGWSKYGYGSLDLTHLPSSERILSRTNVSGTSPKFEFFKSDTTLPPLPRWRMVYIRARYLENNWTKGHYNALPNLKAHPSRVTAIDSNGMVLVSGSLECVAVYDLDSITLKYTIPGHGAHINCIQLHGHNVAVSSSDGAIRVYNVTSGRSVYTFHGRSPAEKLKFVSKDVVISTYSDRCVRVWSLMEKSLKHTLRGHQDEIECVAVSGQVCVTGDWSGTVIFWDISEGAILHQISETRESPEYHKDSVTSCSVDDDVAVTGDGEGKVVVWKILTADPLHVLKAATKDVYCLEMTTDYIAAAGSGGVIAVWSRKDHSLLYTLSQHLGVVRSVKFNGSFLVSGGDRKMICVWSLETGKLLNVVHRNPDLLHLMWVNETKIITASPNNPGSLTVISYW